MKPAPPYAAPWLDEGPGWCVYGCGQTADRAAHIPTCRRWSVPGG